MNINKFVNKSVVIKESYWEKIDQMKVWNYIGVTKISKNLYSIFRNDKTPKCSLSEKNGKLIFWDRGQSFDCIAAIAKLNGKTYKEAIKLCLNICKGSPINILKLKEPTKYIPIFKNWTKEGLNFWDNYEINIKKYPVKQIKGWTYEEDVFIERLGFVFIYNEGYKFYLPKHGNLSKMFFGNIVSTSTWFENNNSNTLMVGKAVKEDLFFRGVFGNRFDYIHLQGEANWKKILNQYDYDNLIINLDNDLTGREQSEKIKEYYSNKSINFLFSPEEKNFTDMDITKAKNYLCTLQFLQKTPPQLLNF